MPRTPRSSAAPTRGRRRTAGSDTAGVVAQISQLVSTNEALRQQNAELAAQNEQLRAQLMEIGSTLGRLTGGRGRGRGRRGAEALVPAEVKPQRARKPITDPEVLAKRSAALVKARAARAEKLAAARSVGNDPAGGEE